MANPTVQTAVCSCNFGTVPAPLTVTSQMTVQVGGMPVATIQDNQFPTFGLCSNPANPAVIAATAAALGTPTPAPCVPVMTAPWAPGCPTVRVCGRPLLHNTGKLMCAYGGTIQVTATPAMTVKVP